MPDKKLTDNEIIKALGRMSCKTLNDCKLINNALDLINRQKAELEKFTNRQNPTAASGYIVENGKVVFFTNMLGGCRHDYENLEEVVKTLNELLQECYSKDEIAFALKCKTEELKTAKAEACKEFAEKVHEELRMYGIKDKFNKSVFLNVVDKAKKELVGEDNV